MGVYLWQEYSWTPWANTTMYYPFTSNYTDQTWTTSINTSNVTITQSTTGYQFSISWNKECSLANVSSSQVFVSYWFKVTTYSWTVQMVDATKDFFYNYNHGTSSYSKTFEYYPQSWSSVRSSQINTSNDTWYHFAYGYDSNSWKILIYLNGSKVYEASANAPRTTTPRKLISTASAVTVIFSELIGESVMWTAQEISDYYNWTKANYWL